MPPQQRTSQPSSEPSGFIDRYFHVSERGSTFGREIRGGLATFLAMSYIIVLNPLIIGAAADSTGQYLGGGSEPNLPAVAAATSLVSGVLTIVMGLLGKFPLAVSSALGLSAFITYGVVVLPGMTWADAMGLVIIEGVILLVLVLTGFRQAIFNAVPAALKTAISVGIGLFIALIGMINAGFIQNTGGTALELGVGGFVFGWPLGIFLITLFALFVMWAMQVRGAILYSIVGASVLAITVESVLRVGPASEDEPYGWELTVPTLDQNWFSMPDFSILGQFNLLGSWESVGLVTATLIVFTLLLANFFDLLGTMVGVSNAGNIKDDDGEIPYSRRIMVSDAIGTIGGGVGATSVNSGFIESTVGVGDGARTGLANIVTGVLFLATIVLAPLASVIPVEAASATLVLVGFLMMQQIVRIDWKDLEVAMPAFMTIIIMPFSYSIANGIGAGFITYVVIKVLRGKWREVHPLMYVTAALFVLYFVSGPIQDALGVT